MIDIKKSLTVGGSGCGLYVPGALVLGNSNEQDSGVSIIDLTSPTLDSRITFTGPAYRYFDAAGELVASAKNEWPLEYRNGTVIGRREPFTASSNVITSLQPEFMTAGDSAGWLTTYTENAGNTYHRLKFNTTQTGLVTLQLFYKILQRENLCLRIATGSANNYKNVGIAGGKITYVGDGITNAAIIDCGAGLYLLRCTFKYVSGILGLLTADAAVTTDDLPRVATANSSAGFIVGYPQIVAGEISAPPLDIGEALGAASVLIDTSAASKITVRYSAGASRSYDTPENTFSLPAGDRYIKRIELRQ